MATTKPHAQIDCPRGKPISFMQKHQEYDLFVGLHMRLLVLSDERGYMLRGPFF